MRISRSARRGALYDASVSEEASGAIYEAIVKPFDFEEVPDVDVDEVLGANSYSRMPRFDGRDKNSTNDANLANLETKNINADKAKPHFKVRNLLYLQKAIMKFKSDGRNYDGIPHLGTGWG